MAKKHIKSKVKVSTYSTQTSSPMVASQAEQIHHSVFAERINMTVLLVLYTLQGIPMGLSGSIPLILKEKGVSYEGLSLFSLVSIPFSAKLLWAPIVDSCYLKQIGRRKTWLLPVQFITGIVMIFASQFVDSWIGEDGSSLNVYILTVFFMFLYFLMATQDIAVDGWALTMLSKENVGYASICNAIGQAFGVFLANQGFVALSDPLWCKRFLGVTTGKAILTLSGFMIFWGVVFICVTVIVAIFKTEDPVPSHDADGMRIEEEGVISTYKHVLSMCKLRSIIKIGFVYVTLKAAYCPADAISGFKLQEYGMPKADLAMFAPVVMVLSLVTSAAASKRASAQPMQLLCQGIPFKLFTISLCWGMGQVAKFYYATTSSGSITSSDRAHSWVESTLFYGSLCVSMVLNDMASSVLALSTMSFSSKVSDPAIGGTYMTFLNTLSNIGGIWPSSLGLWLLPKLTYYTCQMPGGDVSSSWWLDSLVLSGSGGGVAQCVTETCSAAGGSCRVSLDGYTVICFFCVVYGCVWLHNCRGLLVALEGTINDECWLVSSAASSRSIESNDYPPDRNQKLAKTT